MVSPSSPSLDLPSGWTTATPQALDVAALHALLVRHEQAARGGSSASLAAVESEVTGAGAASRRHVLVRDGDGAVRGWAS
ncbi:MAG: GCN5-related N-acetyltransferase, partial [Frankiales bacterium]|nr:GCN5-related N-acetyltransferase [Frankiales bacterium]